MVSADGISRRRCRRALNAMQREEIDDASYVSARFHRHRIPAFDYDDCGRDNEEVRSVRVNPLVRIIVQRMRDPLGAMAYRMRDSAMLSRVGVMAG
ncbi:TPA: hypothetical protein SAY52_000462 [Burkholderia cenocepacia]|uniref:hypothetical protein n=1 Tax=unclassified Burkholderia TaxID=2613784 RepID=UPI00158D9D3C|nr:MULTISPECIES: hypothetical protein [unclassified Burkholderia]HEF5869905.1 hypothetical protein [Burkholderia cenocepacia]